jgi:RNA polymerase sigma-70 factor (ECF subfamily)
LQDDELVARSRNGDLEAASALLARYQGVAYTAALRLLGEPADAEDVTQDALVRAYAQLGNLHDGTTFPSWLRRIAINLSLNVLRRRGLIRFEPLEPPGTDASKRDFPDDAEPSPETRAIVAADRDEIERIVRQLPADQRIAVVLRDMYGYDMADVAAIGRCKLSAAKMRVKRGREALRELLRSAGLAPQATASTQAGVR